MHSGSGLGGKGMLSQGSLAAAGAGAGAGAAGLAASKMAGGGGRGGNVLPRVRDENQDGERFIEQGGEVTVLWPYVYPFNPLFVVFCVCSDKGSGQWEKWCFWRGTLPCTAAQSDDFNLSSTASSTISAQLSSPVVVALITADAQIHRHFTGRARPPSRYASSRCTALR